MMYTGQRSYLEYTANICVFVFVFARMCVCVCMMRVLLILLIDQALIESYIIDGSGGGGYVMVGGDDGYTYFHMCMHVCVCGVYM